MTTALIFAGGTGQRMNSRAKPKQFLEMHGKPILIYTLEHFEYHPQVDEIVIVCLENWIHELKGFLERYGIVKVVQILPGGETGHDSIYNGLRWMAEFHREEDIVLIHDGVRPLINGELITENIRKALKYGTAITVEPAVESVIRSGDGRTITGVPARSEMYVAKAPQTFRFGLIWEAYQRAEEDHKKSIDSAQLLHLYGYPMQMVKSTPNNMKITKPADFYIFRALYEAIENEQIFGL